MTKGLKTKDTMKNIFKILTILFLILSGLQSLEAQNNKGFTLEETKSYHQKFKYPMNEWFGKDDFSRYVYLNMPEFWFHTSLKRDLSNPVLKLPNKPNEQLAKHVVKQMGNQYPLEEYVLKNPINGLIILHKGAIVFEEYPQMLSNQRHIWFSVSKTLVSAAVALLEDHGKINVKLPVGTYLPELKETDWETIPVIDLLDMASGIQIKDNYGDADGPFMTFYNQLGFPRIDRSIDHPINGLKHFKSNRKSGEKWVYNSLNTEILAWMVEEITKEPFSKFIEREIWQKMGAESDGLIISTPSGNTFNAAGISATLRDLARYGFLYTPTGRKEIPGVISSTYIDKIQKGGRAELTSQEKEVYSHATYQWDRVFADGSFMKFGAGGQGLFISPAHDLVLAWFGNEAIGESHKMLTVSLQLVAAGFFDK